MLQLVCLVDSPVVVWSESSDCALLSEQLPLGLNCSEMYLGFQWGTGPEEHARGKRTLVWRRAGLCCLGYPISEFHWS
jgi:hypothetical protein